MTPKEQELWRDIANSLYIGFTTTEACNNRANELLSKARECYAEGRILGMNTSWPLVGVLNRLALAARHLMNHHDCDCHGHEEIELCCKKADEYSEIIHKHLESTSYCPKCAKKDAALKECLEFFESEGMEGMKQTVKTALDR